jgi:hypothetical protein
MNEREQAISNLLYMKRDCQEGSDTDKTLDRAIALLKAQEPGWISVRNRQPTKSDEYLVVITYGDNYSIGIAEFVNFPGDGFWRIGKDSVLLPDFMKITHWMPLPEPPKEG